MSAKDGSAKGTAILTQSLTHHTQAVGDPTTLALGNPASVVQCIYLSFCIMLCCLGNAGPKALSQLVVLLSLIVHWVLLGIHLGIYQHELQEIDKEERGSVDNCLEAMLHRWMQEKDAVKEFGGATKESLVSALHKMEIVLSEAIAQAEL